MRKGDEKVVVMNTFSSVPECERIMTCFSEESASESHEVGMRQGDEKVVVMNTFSSVPGCERIMTCFSRHGLLTSR